MSLWVGTEGGKGRLLEQLQAGELPSRVAFLDDDRVVVGGRTGRLEILRDVSGRPSGPQRTAPEMMRRVGDSPRWRVVNGLVVERP